MNKEDGSPHKRHPGIHNDKLIIDPVIKPDICKIAKRSRVERGVR
jgi:hypothetical protein